MLEHWLRFYLSADDALQPLYDLAWDDPPFAAVVEQLYGYHQLKFPTPFAAAVWALLSQRTSWPQARARMDRLRTALGSPLLVADRSITPLPAAATVAAQSATDLAALIGDARKGATLHAAATAFAAVDPAFLTDAPAAAVRRWLEEIPGIGRWSATLVLVRGLGRMQALRPPFERRLVAAAQKVYGPATAAPALQQLAARYGSQQGYWAHYLRRHSVATRS
jgi:DNA-3-methyladenine glycosylase II